MSLIKIINVAGKQSPPQRGHFPSCLGSEVRWEIRAEGLLLRCDFVQVMCASVCFVCLFFSFFLSEQQMWPRLVQLNQSCRLGFSCCSRFSLCFLFVSVDGGRLPRQPPTTSISRSKQPVFERSVFGFKPRVVLRVRNDPF